MATNYGQHRKGRAATSTSSSRRFAGAITPASNKDGPPTLSMEATARTYRYLDPAEVESQKAEKAKAAAKGGAAGAKK